MKVSSSGFDEYPITMLKVADKIPMIGSPFGTVLANDVFASGIIMSEYVFFLLSP